MKYAIAGFDEKTGKIYDENLIWCEGTQLEAETVVLKDHTKCALFYYGDVNRGCPVNEEATREEFENNPAVISICFYHCSTGYLYE